MADEALAAANQAALDQLLKKIKEQQTQQVAQAQGEALTRGASGGSYEAGRVNGAIRSGNEQTTNAMIQNALAAAQAAREDRLTQEARAYQTSERTAGQQYGTAERVGSQDFTKEQTKSGQDFSAKQQDAQNKYAALENEKQRAFSTGETAKAQQFQAQQDQLQRDFAAEQSLFNSKFTADQNAINRDFQATQQRKAGQNDLLAGGVGSIASVGGSLLGRGLFSGAAGSGLFGGAGSAAGGAGGAAGAAGGLGAAGALGLGALGVGAQVGQTLFAKKNLGVTNREAALTSMIPGGATQLGLAKKAVQGVSKIFCFVPGTMVDMEDGNTKPIQDIKLGDHTMGGLVDSVRMAFGDNLYDYKGVKVTGKHAVFEDGWWKRIETSRYGIPLNDSSIVYSLVTSDHLIYIKGIAFADEHETDLYEHFDLDESIQYMNDNREVK